MQRILRLTLFSGRNCSLCDDAMEVLRSVRDRKRVHFQLDVVNIHEDGNEEYRKKYKYEIPVLLANGSEVGRHRFDTEALESTLVDVMEKDEGS
mmetsp:Transcript_13265/g.37708  ORF Transcript_13265/g.37708 Transcript_13265/m.37708 type:complete len:94 (-) Transcript_13265:3-284(-)